MATLRVRGPYQSEFEIDATARPFWEHREGYEVLDGSSDVPAQSVEVVQPEGSGTTKPNKAASRPAQNKED